MFTIGGNDLKKPKLAINIQSENLENPIDDFTSMEHDDSLTEEDDQIFHKDSISETENYDEKDEEEENKEEEEEKSLCKLNRYAISMQLD